MNLPVEVIDAARAGRCWIVVGSHATAEAFAAGGRSWTTEAQLARRLERAGNGELPGAEGGGAPLRNASPRSLHRARTERPSLAAASSVHAANHGYASLLENLRAARDAHAFAPTRAHVLARTLAPVTLTTTWDDLLDRAAVASWGGVAGGIPPRPMLSKLLHLRGSFAAGEGPVVTLDDLRAHPARFDESGGQELRHRVLFFVGFRPEDEEFALLVEDLARACGGKVPRCHVAVAGGPMDDYLFQKWVWKGLLLFMADPTEALEALHKELA